MHRLSSVKVKLAFWHTAVLALVLVLFGGGTQLYLTRTSLTRIDRSLDGLMGAFAEIWRGEFIEESITPTEAAREAVGEFRERGRRIFVYDSTGVLVAASDSSPLAFGLSIARLRQVGLSPFAGLIALAAKTGGASRTIGVGRDAVRVNTRALTLGGTTMTIVVARSLSNEHEANEAYLRALLAMIPLALAAAAAGGYALARASLAPVVAMAERAEQIGAGMPDARLPVSNPHDELGRLGSVFNNLLARLAAAIKSQRQFMADASHELRTPVAVVRSAADVTLARSDRTLDEYADALRVVSAEGKRLSRIVDDLFLIARVDTGQQFPRIKRLFLEELVAECARSARLLARAKGIRIQVEADIEAPFNGDEALLKRLLMNVLDNAIKHTPPEQTIHVTLDRVKNDYRLMISDPGSGVPEDARERIFERFFRLHSAGGREEPGHSEGAGLGLAIARWVAEAHGGRLELAETGPCGSTFMATLPSVSSSES